MPLTAALWRQEAGVKQLSEFEASLVYRLSSRIARATQRNPVSNKTKQYNFKKKKKGKLGPGDEGGQQQKCA